MRIKRTAFILGMCICLLLCSCGKEKKKIKRIELSKVQNICELSTLKCRYNNVAKSVKESGSGILHWGEKDRKFWIEYTGEAEIGIDMSKVKMEIKDENVMITLPKAELLEIKIDRNTLNEESFVASDDAFFNKNKITASDQQSAIKDAQKKMRQQVEQDEALFSQAEERAKKLIGNYVEKMGNAAGVEYRITWKEFG